MTMKVIEWKSPLYVKLIEVLTDKLDDVYTCDRVWEAWSYETMTEDDFIPASEDGALLRDLADAICEYIDETDSIRFGDLNRKIKDLTAQLNENDKPATPTIKMDLSGGDQWVLKHFRAQELRDAADELQPASHNWHQLMGVNLARKSLHDRADRIEGNHTPSNVLADVWDESGYEHVDYMCNQSTASGWPADPPKNPYERSL